MGSFDEKIIKDIDYKTFVKIINNIPSCIFFKDTELKYRFATHCWEQLQTDDIVGKTDIEVRKDTDNAILAMAQDMKIIENGKGCEYVIKSEIDGHVSYLQLIKEPVFEDGKVIGIVGLINDITEKTLLDEKVKELNTVDMLTKVLNRQAGTEAISISLEVTPENKVFCLLDMNGFKDINDKYGHQMGDKVLQELGKVLNNSVRDTDIVMRLGGDEFIVLLNNIHEISQAEAFIRRLQVDIGKINIEGLRESLAISIGAKRVSIGSTFDSLYALTDKMMYEAKKLEKDHYVISE